MWKSRLFWKLFVAYAGLYFLSAVAIVVLISRWHQNAVEDQVVARLKESAILVSSVLQHLPSDTALDAQNTIRELGQTTGTRITLVDFDGNVLADSERTFAEVGEMDNHKNRIELVQAVREGFGVSRRDSRTLKLPMLYVALRHDRNDEPVALVRTARPMSFIRRQVAQVQRLVGIIFLLISLCVIALTYWIVTRIIQPINVLKAATQSISKGDYATRAQLNNHDELGQLGIAFNEMSAQLRNQVAQLRVSQERISMILSSINDGIIAVDRELSVLFANPTAGEQFGFTPKLVKGSRLPTAIRSNEILKAVDETFARETGQQTEIQEHGSRSVLAITTSPMPGSQCPGVVIVSRDVTKLRRLDGLRREFVSNVSHEFHTPLASIKANAETLSQGAIDDVENRLRFVQQIEEQAGLLQQLVADVMTITRVESGRTAFEIESVSLEKVVGQCLDRFKTDAQEKQIELEENTHNDRVLVLANEEGVRQILDNIVENAIRYTPEQGRIEIAWTVDDSMATIEISDTGIGIREEDQPRIFERFFRVDKARSRQLGGTGLGLSIVKHMTQFFGGSVSVSSQLGEGTTFRVRLPLALP